MDGKYVFSLRTGHWYRVVSAKEHRRRLTQRAEDSYPAIPQAPPLTVQVRAASGDGEMSLLTFTLE